MNTTFRALSKHIDGQLKSTPSLYIYINYQSYYGNQLQPYLDVILHDKQNNMNKIFSSYHNQINGEERINFSEQISTA